jgi:acyl transferase domain-containing protein/NADPH:quinone reductase-like Zn-dependent oxidoreductase/NAD(P)-dependent dehydrogenase (short-subunit alcohol dehydrogenase family)/acyl carrier protein
MNTNLRSRDNIAIVGMACRFPGADNPAEFWEILKHGRDVVGEISADRWGTDYYFHRNRTVPGKSYTFSAGLLNDVEHFDADFFGISPREASQMDPQQRLLLELAWEALEDGGQVAERLAGSNCAVYVGISSMDWGHRRVDDPSSADAYFMSGATLSIAANRISYVLDLQGPSLAIDTACSSSLVAIHHACQGLWHGEFSMALAGGVNLLLSPFPFIGFSKASMLAPDGRCRAFDADGKGYVRAEGGALLFLKPFRKAKADGDHIHAVIIGSGVNADGRSKGLSMPRSEAQEALLRSVYEQAAVAPESVCYLEAHGTGTAAGDPQEASAIGHALGVARGAANPLPIGSAKTNVGHLESAAGMVGLVKVVLALKHRGIPPSLHFERPNPNIPFDSLNLRVVTEFTPLPENGARAVMGVNSFGFGGANAHVIVQEYLQADGASPSSSRGQVVPLFLSARSEPALKETAERYRALLSRVEAPAAYDVAHAAATRRQQHEHRLVVFGRDAVELSQRLEAFTTGGHADGVVSGRTIARPAKLALLFSGNGSQWPGMGRRLLATDRLFRWHVQKVDERLRPLAGFSVMKELAANPSRLFLTEVAQPLLFALQVGLFETLIARGLCVDAVMGHSVGEVAAAYAAGAFDLEQAVRVIHERSAAQGQTRGHGRMAAVGLALTEAEAEISRYDGEIEIAAVNSPASVTLSGSLQALEQLKGRLDGRGVFSRILDLDYAFHSRTMDRVREPLAQGLAGLEPAPLSRPFVSTVTGTMLEGKTLGAEYWWENVRSPVRLDKAVATLLEQGFSVFLEVGPHPILQTYVQENLRAAKAPGSSFATLKRDVDDEMSLWRVLGTGHVLGCPLDFKKVFRHRSRYVDVPLYPWQRESHWHDRTNESLGVLGPPLDHPLLGYRLSQAEGVWENHLDVDRVPYLADHVVGGAVMFPAAGFIEIALAAAGQSEGTSHELESLEIRAPLVFEGAASKTVRFTLGDDGSFTIRSRPRLSNQTWIVNVLGRLRSPSLRSIPPRVEVRGAVGARSEWIPGEEHYRRTNAVGLSYGPAFAGVEEMWSSGDEALAVIRLPAPVAAEASRYRLHPCLLDSCLQVLLGLGAWPVDFQRPVCFLPFHIGRVISYRPGGTAVYCRVVIEKRSARSVVAHFQVLDEAGDTVAELEDFRFRRARLAREGAGTPGRYAFRPVLKSRSDDSMRGSLPRPADMVSRLEDAIGEQPYRSTFYNQVLPLFDALVAAFAYRAIHGLVGSQSHFTLSSLMAAGDIDSRHAVLLSRLLGILEEDRLLTRTDSEWSLTGGTELPGPEEIWRLLLADFPSYLHEASFIGRCGLHLAAVLRGGESPPALMSKGGVSITGRLGDASPTWRITNLAAKEALCEIAKEWPKGRRLRILELSGGGVNLAADALSVLPKDRCHYVFASPDEAVRVRGQAELAHLGSHSVTALDINGDLVEQGWAANSFDVIIASHVLHSSDNVGRALDNIRWLLGRSGLLLLLERSPERQSDLVFGIQPEWWRRTTEIRRPLSRLRTVEEWRVAALHHGFVDAVPWSERAPDVPASTYLLIAQNSEVTPEAVDTASPASQGYLILCDQDGDSAAIADYVVEQLRSDGHRPFRVTAGKHFSRPRADEAVVAPESAEDFERLLGMLREEDTRVTEIVHLMGLSLSQDAADSDLCAVQDRRCSTAVHLVQSLCRGDGDRPPRLWLVTAGAVVLPGSGALGVDSPIPSQAPLWGLGRVLMSEHPELQCRLIDLYAKGQANLAGRFVMAELREPDEETEVLVTADARYAMRLDRVELDAPEVLTQIEPSGRARLDFANPGSLNNLRWYAEPRQSPQSGEIEIRVRATGLNFRDLMYAMGMLSDEAVENGFAGATLGMECAGDVVRVGPDVTDFEVGKSVVCFGRACFASHVTTQTTAVAAMPPGWTYEEAATVPGVFFTVYYALNHLAGLRRGEKLLIHGAAGGVGMAAIQYARFCGAEIFATAGSDEKRDFLRLLGVEHVLDSRSLAFADEILETTGGSGVDVVLNFLSGEAVSKNLAVLKPFGRFLELGKRDYYENAKIGLRPFRNNIAYFGIDADQLMKERSDLAGRIFREMMELFDKGAFRPLPHRTFSSTRIADAFRYMQQSLQIGKVVVSYDSPMEAIQGVAPLAREFELDPEGSYLISGGLGGFGLATARWLLAKGARNLVLVGRRGAASPEAQAGVGELEAAGARVLVCNADVARFDDLHKVFQQIAQDLPPLKGVLHAAMVLEDALMRNLGRDSLQRVLAPKMLGARNLHELTRDLPLDFFVLYSSATTTLGNPGQGSYVAANMYLESLAECRRRVGLPAIAVGWGPIGDVGFLARNERVRDVLVARIGGQLLSSAQALNQLEELLKADRTGVAVADLDWRRLQKTMPGMQSPTFRALGGRAGEDVGDGAVDADIHALIANLSSDEVLQTVTELLSEQMANVLRLPVQKIASTATIYDLGMDSLMAVELVTAIESRFGINVPPTAVTGGATLAQIAGRIVTQLSGSEEGAEPPERDERREMLNTLVSRHGEKPSPKDVAEFLQHLSEGG